MKVLILSYHFPPHAIVGSRRWAKFAKYLARKGHAVDVIAAAAPADARSPWDEDLVPSVRVHPLPPRYPRALDGSPANAWGKLRYKLALAWVRLGARGTPYDRAAFWEKPLRRKIDALFAAHGAADVVIANGPPFGLLAHAVALKEAYPNVPVVVDVRDPWTWWFNQGYADLAPARRAFEADQEAAVLDGADLVLTPSEGIRAVLAGKYPRQAGKLRVLPHGYDPAVILPRAPRAPGALRLLYYGSLYPGARAALTELVPVLQGLDRPVALDVYAFADKFSDLLRSKGALTVRVRPPAPERALFAELAAADFALLFSFRGIEDFLATKYFEIAATRTPIALVGEDGAAARFIEGNGLGIFLPTGRMATECGKLTRSFVPAPFNAAPYAFDRLTDDLLALLPKR